MLKGSLVALITPFNSDGSINFEKFGELIEYHIKNKTDGLVILGTTGEASTLSFEEEANIVSYCVKKTNKRIPLIFGSGSNETSKAVSQSRLYSSLGADYLLVITPYYNKTNDKGLIKHFQMIADSSLCPIIVYNVPSRTGMNISIDVIAEISTHPNIIGIKEASGDFSYMMKLSKYINDNFSLYSGNDDLIVPTMSIGGKGCISVLANIAPKATKMIIDYCLNNDYNNAIKMQNKLLPLIDSLFIDVNPIPIKEAMNYLGFMVGGYRMPLTSLDYEKRDKLINQINNIRELVDL